MPKGVVFARPLCGIIDRRVRGRRCRGKPWDKWKLRSCPRYPPDDLACIVDAEKGLVLTADGSSRVVVLAAAIQEAVEKLRVRAGQIETRPI